MHLFSEELKLGINMTACYGAKGIAVLPLFPIFRPFFHFHKNPSSSVISGTFSRENRHYENENAKIVLKIVNSESK